MRTGKILAVISLLLAGCVQYHSPARDTWSTYLRGASFTDMTEMPAETYACLEGLDCLFMNALRLTPHPTHQSLSQALEQVERIRPRKAYFIHASHQLGMHAEVEATLPPHVRLAYDGLTVEIG